MPGSSAQFFVTLPGMERPVSLVRLALDARGQASLPVARPELVAGARITVLAPSASAQGGLSSRSLVFRPPSLPQGPVQTGEVIVSEIQKDPTFVSDSVGEWIELFNTRNYPVDIEGWVLSDLGSDATVLDNAGAGIFVPARSYLVLAKNDNPTLNGGVWGAYVYSGMTLSNGADEVVLSRAGVLVDSVVYDDGVLWPDDAGSALQLSTRRLAPIWNDDGQEWCSATMPYGPGDLGTPGTRNDTCP